MTQQIDTQETIENPQFYTDSNRNVVVNLPIAGSQVKLRPATAKDLSAVSMVVSEGIKGKKVSGLEGAIFHIARLLTPVKELKENEDAWESRFEQLNSYDFDAEDLGVLLTAFATFRSASLPLG